MTATCVAPFVGMMNMPSPVVEEVVKNVNYQYVGDIPDGAGCSGTVVQAFDTQANEIVAIKVIPKKDHHLHRQEAVYQEVRTQQLVHDHPNVVTLRDFFEDEGSYYLVMDYCPGGDLFSYVASQYKYGGLKEEDAKEIFLQLVEVVDYMHKRGVCHADLKLENILIDEDLNIRICDFGMSFETARVGEQTGTLRGTPYYMSPTRLSVKKERFGGEADDLWACGILLYKMLTCEIPFDTVESDRDTFSAKCAKILAAVQKEGPTFQSKLRRKGILTETQAEFIGGLLEMEDRCRWTPNDCLAHSWLKPSTSITLQTCVPVVHNAVVVEPPAAIALC